jgi:hypothetical protein
MPRLSDYIEVEDSYLKKLGEIVSRFDEDGIDIQKTNIYAHTRGKIPNIENSRRGRRVNKRKSRKNRK